MELDLGLSLSPHTNSSKLGFDFDLNKHCAIDGGTASCLDNGNLCFESTFQFNTEEDCCYVPKQRVFALNGQPNEEDEDPLESESSIIYEEEENSEVVGWPPVKTCMIKYRSYHQRHSHRNHHHYPYHHHGRRNTVMNNRMAAIESVGSSSTITSRSSMYVKVKMDGVAITRKVDIKLFNSYESLTDSLIAMFTQYEDCDREDTNYAFTFQGKDGDWLLPGDVPWRIFAESVNRISIIRDRPCAYTRLLF
ncbi:hypothetical protein CARUB_v10005589mg [Capsella rubella]|uniref:Auxin-responsive protein n=1 Tax=Capsella rubella TaxID=81985 RepID=R0H1F4_9BRAS|nr:auxin-responsive protein IAA29 isoform X1 [Capsella rubella]EOA17318.1 hypothetical protein CARUB_v10005589mg [Capsella rubella]